MPKPTSRTDRGTPSSVWLKILDQTDSPSVPQAEFAAAASADTAAPPPEADPRQQSSAVAAAAAGKQFEAPQPVWAEKGATDKRPRRRNPPDRRSSARNSNRRID